MSRACVVSSVSEMTSPLFLLSSPRTNATAVWHIVIALRYAREFLSTVGSPFGFDTLGFDAAGLAAGAAAEEEEEEAVLLLVEVLPPLTAPITMRSAKPLR